MNHFLAKAKQISDVWSGAPRPAPLHRAPSDPERVVFSILYYCRLRQHQETPGTAVKSSPSYTVPSLSCQSVLTCSTAGER